MINLDEQLSENFNLREFVKSSTAEKNKIDNTPTLLAIAHIRELVKNLLQPLRDHYGKPIKITSGYRSIRLNTMVGGVRNSAHTTGYAVDIQPTSDKMADFEKMIVDYLKENNIAFDQCIRESSGKTKWVHLGLKNIAGKQRKQIFDITK